MVLIKREREQAMVLAWYVDSSPRDQRLPHKPDSCETVPLDVLATLGVLYWKVYGTS